MSDGPRQLVLDLMHRPALGAEDFLVSRSNSAAVELVDRWPDWPGATALVVGPPRSGKTHLANVWRHRSEAAIVEAREVGERSVELLARHHALAIEDLDRGIGNERGLFHLLNMAREIGGSLLLTSARPAGELEISLPDLRSRLRALPMVRLEQPDDELLGAVLVKLFSDRQLAVEPSVIAYVARHVDRSMAAVVEVVDRIDRQALAARRKVTRTLAAEVMAGLSRSDAERDEDDEAAA